MADCNKDDGRGSMIGGIIVLGIGLYFLAWRMDYIPAPGDSWPMFLIIVGIALIVGNLMKRRSGNDRDQQQM